MEAAAHAGVDFFACARSLANHEFVEGTLPEWLGQVPAAIPAIREWTKDGPRTSSRDRQRPSHGGNAPRVTH